MKQLQNIVCVSSTDPEVLLLNDCNEGAIAYVQDRHQSPVLELAAKITKAGRTLATATWAIVTHIRMNAM